MSPSDSPLFDSDDSTESDSEICTSHYADDIFQLSAEDSMALLCQYLQVLLKRASKQPLTPPRSPPQSPDETDDTRHKSELTGSPGLNLDLASPDSDDSRDSSVERAAANAIVRPPDGDADRAMLYQTLAKRFNSKKPPPIPIEGYLERLHKFCPSSPAVYLAVTYYIHKFTRERQVVVSPYNVHRLLLAGIRVATKALEDRNFHNSRFAKVGGISLGELGRLEVGFCFLSEFELRVDERMLTRQLALLNQRDY